MPPRTKQDYPALMKEYDERIAAGETVQAIKADFQSESRGIHWGTFQNHRTQAKKKAPRETPMSADDTPVEVLPGQMSIEDADTPAEVHYGAVHEVDALPDGYAKTIQPMQPYSDAEEWALNTSMKLYGFLGAIVLDQYGRILDGNQRQRIARLRGLAVPSTTTLVRDDAHAIEIARALNTVRRHYTTEQRQALAPMMRDQGFTYEAIAEALGVGKATVYRDVMGVLRVRTEPTVVPNGTTIPENHLTVVPNGTTIPEAPPMADTSAPPTSAPLIRGKDGHLYPPTRTKPTRTTPAKQVKAQEPEPRQPPRKVLQDALMLSVLGIPDKDVWDILATLWSALEHYNRSHTIDLNFSEPRRELALSKLKELLPLFPAAVVEDFELNQPAESRDQHTLALNQGTGTETPTDNVQGTDEMGLCPQCEREMTVEDAAICGHCGEMFHGPCLQRHMEDVEE